MHNLSRTTSVVALLLVALLLAACTVTMPMAATNPAPQPEAGKLTLADVHVRAAPLEGGNSAAYLYVLNGLDQPVRLAAAGSAAANVVELHETVNDNGVMKMEPHPEGFEVPAGGVLELKPGGKHVMLLGLVAPLAAGDTVDLTLSFDNGEELSVSAPVVNLGAPPMQMQGEEGSMQHGDMQEGAMHGETEGTEEAMEGEGMGDAAGHTHEGDHAAMMAAVPAALMEAYAALPIDALHDMDEVLAAGTVDPSFAMTVEEMQKGLAAIEWPEAVAEQIPPIQTALEELAAALEAGDTALAGELAAKAHGLIHTLEFAVEPAQ